MPFSFRLDPETEARIRRLSKATGRSKSAIVREAVTQYGAEPPSPALADPSALDRLQPFVGVIATSVEYSTDTHKKYRAALTRKVRGRRSR